MLPMGLPMGLGNSEQTVYNFSVSNLREVPAERIKQRYFEVETR